MRAKTLCNAACLPALLDSTRPNTVESFSEPEFFKAFEQLFEFPTSTIRTFLEMFGTLTYANRLQEQDIIQGGYKRMPPPIVI